MSGWKGQRDFHELPTKAVNDELRRVCLVLLRGLIVRSPVDTGRLRGAWVVSIGKSNRNATGKEDKTGTTAYRQGSLVIREAVGDKSVFMNNNLPYAEPIEDGHGGRAPGVMVEATLRQFRGQR